jgi:hypothetical protein
LDARTVNVAINAAMILIQIIQVLENRLKYAKIKREKK